MRVLKERGITTVGEEVEVGRCRLLDKRHREMKTEILLKVSLLTFLLIDSILHYL